MFYGLLGSFRRWSEVVLKLKPPAGHRNIQYTASRYTLHVVMKGSLRPCA